MNNRYLYKGKIKGNLTGYEELDWAIGNLIVEQSTGKHFIIDLSHFNESTRLCDTVIEVDPSTICQCTGLKDKNGKLIWENDIVWDSEERKFYKIIFSQEDMCYYAQDSDGYKDTFESCYGSSIDVESNIFDNPELLEVGE